MRGLRAKQLSWLERIPDKDEVTSSILVSPTTQIGPRSEEIHAYR
jgi:hypothetical protein